MAELHGLYMGVTIYLLTGMILQVNVKTKPSFGRSFGDDETVTRVFPKKNLFVNETKVQQKFPGLSNWKIAKDLSALKQQNSQGRGHRANPV